MIDYLYVAAGVASSVLAGHYCASTTWSPLRSFFFGVGVGLILILVGYVIAANTGGLAIVDSSEQNQLLLLICCLLLPLVVGCKCAYEAASRF